MRSMPRNVRNHSIHETNLCKIKKNRGFRRGLLLLIDDLALQVVADFS